MTDISTLFSTTRARVQACRRAMADRRRGGQDQTRRLDRVFSLAVLGHLEDLPAVIAAGTERLAESGVPQASIPAQGDLTRSLAWRIAGISYRLRTGQVYRPAMRHDYTDDAAELITIVRRCFTIVRVRWFPLPARHVAFYGCTEARRPHLDRCVRVWR